MPEPPFDDRLPQGDSGLGVSTGRQRFIETIQRPCPGAEVGVRREVGQEFGLGGVPELDPEAGARREGHVAGRFVEVEARPQSVEHPLGGGAIALRGVLEGSVKLVAAAMSAVAAAGRYRSDRRAERTRSVGAASIASISAAWVTRSSAITAMSRQAGCWRGSPAYAGSARSSSAATRSRRRCG